MANPWWITLRFADGPNRPINGSYPHGCLILVVQVVNVLNAEGQTVRLGVRSISWKCCGSMSSPVILYVRGCLEAFPGSGRGNIRRLRPNSSHPVSGLSFWL